MILGNKLNEKNKNYLTQLGSNNHKLTNILAFVQWLSIKHKFSKSLLNLSLIKKQDNG
jgi:hypothetical protein